MEQKAWERQKSFPLKMEALDNHELGGLIPFIHSSITESSKVLETWGLGSKTNLTTLDIR